MLSERIDESQLVSLDVMRIRMYIGVTLLSYSGIQAIHIPVYSLIYSTFILCS